MGLAARSPGSRSGRPAPRTSVWPPGAQKRDIGLAARRPGCWYGRPAPRTSVWPPGAQKREVGLAARRPGLWRASCFFRKISMETPIEAKRMPFRSRLKGEQSELVLGRTGKTELIPWLVDLIRSSSDLLSFCRLFSDCCSLSKLDILI
ncbi:Uncharacterized protein Rs2_40940 [Raphanus sativus]|nr:hypothetical protein Rs2_40937 [Raphanus sativus]KAJ4875922.1 Uncharacterized protein Rs2_40940 [Raphanus sativus]